jgi:integral membrane sensor domain MASE1
VFSALPGPLLGAVVGLFYLALAQYVIWLNDPVNAGAGYWPAAGVTLVALLLLPVRRWGWVIGAVVAAEIGGDFLHGYPFAASSWWAAGNVAEPVVAALLLRRFGRGGRLTPFGALVPFLLAGVVVGPFVGAAIGSVGTSTVYDVSQLEVFLKWWAGDGLGVLVVAPLLLCFREPSVPGRSWLEIAATVAVVVAITLLSFRNWQQEWDVVLPFLILPAMMLASVRLGIRGAAITGFLVAELANLATALGYGPFRLVVDADLHAVTVLQVFLASALTAALVIAVLIHDALEATRHYERQRSVADAFQVAALPEQLPTVPGLSFGAGYEAASNDSALHVGGDWYDAFPLPNGSTAFVIGDVAGHDLPAAVVMAQVRNGLRSLLFELHDPSKAMTAMDDQLAAPVDPIPVTAIIALYTDGDLVWTNAGHPPLLLVPSSGPVRYLTSQPNRILAVGRSRYDTHRTRLDPGDVVVAYTDGVMEHRARSLDDGLVHLAQLAEQATTRDPQSLCDLLLEQGLDGLRRHDDACVIAIRRDERADGADPSCSRWPTTGGPSGRGGRRPG